MNASSWPRSSLAERYRALGSDLEDWTCTTSSPADKHEAVRIKARIMDASRVPKVRLVGSHLMLQRAQRLAHLSAVCRGSMVASISLGCAPKQKERTR